MITIRKANQCGQADYGWLKARYTFSFGHYFDPDFLGFKTLKVLNQEVIAPANAFQPKTFPHVDILNIILQGSAEYRDNLGNKISAKEGECLIFSPHRDMSYSEHNLCPETPLTRLQLWIKACPQSEYQPTQKIKIQDEKLFLIASPEGESNSLSIRQQVWIYQIHLKAGDELVLPSKGKNAYLQSIQGPIQILSAKSDSESITCGDGVFLQDEDKIKLKSSREFRGLFIDLDE